MKRKIFGAIFALILALSLVLVPAVPAAAATIDVPADYATIQEAINAASPGDTITVAAGTYTENITIDKSLTLTGEDSATTIIDGGVATPVDLTLDGEQVEISGFGITNGPNGIFLNPVINGSSVSIHHNQIYSNNYGIYAYDIDESTVTIYDNYFHDNQYGVFVENELLSSTLTFEWNDIIGSGVFVYRVLEDSTLNVRENTVSGCSSEAIYSYWLGSSGSTVTIENNTISQCENDGIWIDNVVEGSALYIIGNIIDASGFGGSGYAGIDIGDVDLGGTVEITENDITNNNDWGIYIYQVGYDGSETAAEYYALFETWGASNIHISGNTITGNSQDGIYISNADFAANIDISGNDAISSNGYSGINLEYLGYNGADFYGASINTADVQVDPAYPLYTGPIILIDENTIADNGYYGILQYNDWENGTDVTIEDNIITGNYDAGIYNDGYYVENDGHLTIRGNTINDNDLDEWYGGVYLYTGFYYASTVTFEDNYIAGNGYYGVYLDTIGDGSSAIFRNNTVGAYESYSGNGENGIEVDYVQDGSTLEITGNTVNQNDDWGIYLSSVYNTSSAVIRYNNVTNNFGGISIGQFGDITINFNNITGNSGYDGLSYYDADWLNARHNWWGDASGPTHPDNPSGSGDTISDWVEFDSWLTAGVDNGVTVTTESGEDTVDALDEADTEVLKTGDGTPEISVFSYSGNPGGADPVGFVSFGKYIDVQLDDATDVDQVEIRVYFTSDEISGLDESTLTIAFWNGTDWVRCSDTGLNIGWGEPDYRGFVHAYINTTVTTPSVDDLVGTPFMPMAEPGQPEMSVEGNSVEIADGDSSPSLTDHTDFGNADVTSGTVARTFTIKNTGSGELTLSGTPKVAVEGANAADFTVTLQPSSPVAVGGNTTFQVTFDPSSTGNRTATLSIDNDDSDENPYNFSIQGTGTKVLTVTGITADNKEYNGNTTATLDTSGATLVGVEVGDDVTANVTAAGVFADKNVGAGKTVTVSGITLEGADAGYYTLTQPTATANITAKTVTPSVTVADKVYDGTIAATITGRSLTGAIGGDTVILTGGTATFSDAAVGNNKTVTVTGLSLTGTDAGNYILSSTSATTTASITEAPPGGGGDGGGAPSPPPGVTNVDNVVSSQGVFSQAVTASSDDGKVEVQIDQGTTGKTKEGEPITEISVVPMTTPPAPPADSNVIGITYDLGPEGATFSPPVTITFEYDPASLPSGVDEQDLVIAFYDKATGTWVVLDNITIDPVTHTISGEVSHFTPFAVITAVTPPAPAAFSVSNLTIQPAEANPEQTVVITVSVSNTGGTEGSYTVVLKINGVKEAEKNVTIAAGSSQKVSFNVAKADAGNYSVVVGELAGSFTVVTPLPPAPSEEKEEVVPTQPAEEEEELPVPAQPFNWPLVGGIIAVVIIVAALITFFMVRRRAH